MKRPVQGLLGETNEYWGRSGDSGVVRPTLVWWGSVPGPGSTPVDPSDSVLSTCRGSFPDFKPKTLWQFVFSKLPYKFCRGWKSNSPNKDPWLEKTTSVDYGVDAEHKRVNIYPRFSATYIYIGGSSLYQSFDPTWGVTERGFDVFPF